jgi:16S rRNA (uracil1498-N3)-methyltransferase
LKLFVLNAMPDGDTVRLEGRDYHYLVNVRRLASGEFFPAVLPNGEETLIQMLSAERGVLTGKVSKDRASFGFTQKHEGSFSISLPPIILFQALPKAGKMDLIVRQAAEGGIAEIVPFVSEFSVGGSPAKEFGQKFTRWQRIIKEARQQSGSKTATSICLPKTTNELIEYWKKIKKSDTLGLLFHHQGIEQESLHGYLNNNPNAVTLAVGPEGGFSNTEVCLFIENGFKPFTIGDTVLRTETAALYFAAAVKILLLERDSWELKQTKESAG